MLKLFSRCFLVFNILSISILILCSMIIMHSPLPSGIEGHIYQASGNLMPMRGRTAKQRNKGLNCELAIYQATTAIQTSGHIPLFTQINTRLVASLHTDSTGYYHINLPAGQYSVFIRQNDSYFAAETDDKGILNPVQVTAKQITHRDFTFNLHAVY